jgi:hypothetical protein
LLPDSLSSSEGPSTRSRNFFVPLTTNTTQCCAAAPGSSITGVVKRATE